MLFSENIGGVRRYIYMAVTLALLVSTKLIGLVFVIPFILKYFDFHKGVFVYIEKVVGFLLLVLISYILVNGFIVFDLKSGSIPSLIDQQLTNFYHYSTGHGTSEPSGVYQLNKALESFGFLIALGLIGIGLSFKGGFKENRPEFLGLLIVLMIVFTGLIGSRYFVDRNYLIVLLISVLFLSIGLGNYIKDKALIRHKWLICYLAMILFLVSFLTKNNNYENLVKKYESSACGNTVSIGIDISKVDKIEGVPPVFSLKGRLKEELKRFNGYQCVLINSQGDNKHLAKFVLPMEYKLVARYGQMMLFKAK